MKLVLDASSAIRASLHPEAEDELLNMISASSPVMSPELFVAEVTSGLWKHVNAGHITVDGAIARLARALRLVQRRVPLNELAEEALREAVARRHSVYDMFYVVLARREEAALLTLDARLRKVAEAMRVAVI